MADFVSIFLVLSGPFVGSFLGLVVDRLPAGRSLLSGRSRCNHCQAPLAVRDLIPFLSWFLNRGRCRYCGGAIPFLYNWIELAAVIVPIWALLIVPGWLAWVTVGLGWALLVLAIIDSRHLYLPDQITLPMIPAGLLVIYLIAPERLLDHVIGAIVGFGVIWGLRRLYFLWKGTEGIGLGDAKLLAAAGAWVSWQGLPSVILVAAGGALIFLLSRRLVGQKRLEITEKTPFGSYLAAGLWLIRLYGPLAIG